MKKRKLNYLKRTFLLLLVIITSANCERDLTDEIVEATFSKTAEIFTDNFVGLGEDFYLPYGDSKFNAFSVDNDQGYNSNASIRIDVPSATDPLGTYAGAIFRIDGAGRNLTDYDALTFWAKASQGVTIGEFGFGEDFIENKFLTTLTNVNVGTLWTKYTIPIPDASKLLNERGMFRYAAGTQGTNGSGYILWLDEIKFEKLGTIAQPQPKILNGLNVVQQSFTGSEIQLTGLSQTFNLESGQNQTVNVAPSYFKFLTSNSNVATVNDLGLVTLVGAGSATITATISGVIATGSLVLNVGGAFVNAPNPTLPQQDVISIFSDTYTGVAGFNPGFFAGGNTGNIAVQTFANNAHLSYETIDFVGLGWNGTVNVSAKTMIHLDIQLKSSNGSNLRVELIDFGPDDVDNGLSPSNGTAGGFIVSNQLSQDNWVGLDIPLSSFTLPTGGGGLGSPNKNNIGYIVFVSNSGASFLVDNIYFY